jgi:hypothetical protein
VSCGSFFRRESTSLAMPTIRLAPPDGAVVAVPVDPAVADVSTGLALVTELFTSL